VVAPRELALTPDWNRPDTHAFHPTERLRGASGKAVGDPGHGDFLLAEELETLGEADRGDIRVEVALLLQIRERRVEPRVLRIGELGLADHRRLELVDRVEILLADEREEPGAAISVLVAHPERGDPR